MIKNTCNIGHDSDFAARASCYRRNLPAAVLLVSLASMGKNGIRMFRFSNSGVSLPTTVDENKTGVLTLSFGARLIQIDCASKPLRNYAPAVVPLAAKPATL